MRNKIQITRRKTTYMQNFLSEHMAKIAQGESWVDKPAEACNARKQDPTRNVKIGFSKPSTVLGINLYWKIAIQKKFDAHKKVSFPSAFLFSLSVPDLCLFTCIQLLFGLKTL